MLPAAAGPRNATLTAIWASPGATSAPTVRSGSSAVPSWSSPTSTHGLVGRPPV